MLSVIVCTYNRLDLLTTTLEDLARSIPPTGEAVEVLVVDNMSTDSTATWLREHETCGPFPLRSFREETQGHSAARNRGIREAHGDWLVFTDDDVRLEPDWLATLIHETKCHNAVAGGGRVVPVWPRTLPRWVTREGCYYQRGIFLDYCPDTVSRMLTPDDPEPFGCNMIFNTTVFQQFGLFRTDLGRVGKRLSGNDDTEMFGRLYAANAPVCYAANAVVNHPVPPERLQLGYLLRWKYWAGYGRSIILEGAVNRQLGGVPLWVLGAILRSIHGLGYQAMQANLPAMVYYLGNLCYNIGACVGYRQRRSC